MHFERKNKETIQNDTTTKNFCRRNSSNKYKCKTDEEKFLSKTSRFEESKNAIGGKRRTELDGLVIKQTKRGLNALEPQLDYFKL